MSIFQSDAGKEIFLPDFFFFFPNRKRKGHEDYAANFLETRVFPSAVSSLLVHAESSNVRVHVLSSIRLPGLRARSVSVHPREANSRPSEIMSVGAARTYVRELRAVEMLVFAPLSPPRATNLPVVA